MIFVEEHYRERSTRKYSVGAPCFQVLTRFENREQLRGSEKTKNLCLSRETCKTPGWLFLSCGNALA